MENTIYKCDVPFDFSKISMNDLEYDIDAFLKTQNKSLKKKKYLKMYFYI